VEVRRGGLRSGHLAVDVEADPVGLPIHAVGVVAVLVRHHARDLAVLLPGDVRRLVRGVDRAVDGARPVAVALDDVQFLMLPRIVRVRLLLVRQQPERVPGADLLGEIGPDFEIPVGLGEIALRGQQAGFPATGNARRRPVRHRRDRQGAVLDLERVIARPFVHEGGIAESNIGVRVAAVLRADIGPGRSGAGLRDAACVEFFGEGQLVAGQIDHEYSPRLSTRRDSSIAAQESLPTWFQDAGGPPT
jgi:hypothetical protein